MSCLKKAKGPRKKNGRCISTKLPCLLFYKNMQESVRRLVSQLVKVAIQNSPLHRTAAIHELERVISILYFSATFPRDKPICWPSMSGVTQLLLSMQQLQLNSNNNQCGRNQ